MGARALLALLASAITLTDTYPSVTSSEKLYEDPNFGKVQHSTDPSLQDELIYATELASKHGTHNSARHSLDQSEMLMMQPPFFTLPPYALSTSVDAFSTHQSLSEAATVFIENPYQQNPYNDETLEKASRLLDRDYGAKEDTTTERTWFDDEQSQIAGSEIFRSLQGETKLDILGRLKGTSDLESDMNLKAEEDNDERLESLGKQGSIRSMEAFSVPAISDGREEGPGVKVERRATASTPALVWGEVGRGIVAATPDYAKGEIGRRPLVLAGAGVRGRARSGPYFEEDSPPPNITAPAGSTVYMDCRVAMLQDKVVTWAARRADRLQLLTVGRQPYSADKRLSLSFRYPNNWRLRLLGAERKDQGLYECQVAAHPPLIRQIYLTVISPEVSIWDESGRAVVERYYKAGSSLQLTCSAVQLLQPPELLGWWKENEHLTQGISCNVTGVDSATCTLIVDQVTRSHAGTYTCGAFPWPGAEVGAAPEWTAPTLPSDPPTPGPDLPYTVPQTEYYANATVAVHVLHGNLIGVAVLPNTGKSVGMARACYISVQKIILGLSLALYLQDR